MPFDIASRRLTPFSLKDGKSKGEIKRYIKGVIQDIVENILENGKRVKTGFQIYVWVVMMTALFLICFTRLRYQIQSLLLSTKHKY